MKVLIDYNWPGNVRELQNLVERLCTITIDSVIRLKDVAPDNMNKTEIKGVTLKEAVSAFEKGYISETLESVSWSRKKTADKLGVHRNTLLAKINELGLKTHKIKEL